MINISPSFKETIATHGFQINNFLKSTQEIKLITYQLIKTNLQIGVRHCLNSLVEVASARCQHFTSFLFPTNKFLG